jgi:hypothetical protein
MLGKIATITWSNPHDKTENIRHDRGSIPRAGGRLHVIIDGSGVDELETKWIGVLDEESNAEGEVFKTVPATPAGALMLLRTIADHIDEYGVNDTLTGDLIGDAIRNAVATLESGRTA